MTDKTVTYQDTDLEPVKEPKGRQMIEFKVAFWTDKLDDEPSRQCWSSGKVTRSANQRYGIRHGERNINTVAEIGPAIEYLAAEADITIHPSTNAKAYAQTSERILDEALVDALEVSD